MTVARRLVPGQAQSATRRTSERRFFLRPDPQINQIVLYVLGLALLRHDVRLYGYLAHANHTHTNAVDARPRSQLSDFFGYQHSLLARALNSHYGRGENLWCPGSYDNVEVHDLDTLEDQLLYLWTNPVADGLVETPEAWPGVLFLPEDFGRTITVRRPKGAFFGGRRPPGHEPTYAPARRALRAARRRRRERVERRRRAHERRRRGRDGAARSRRAAARRKKRKKERAPRPQRDRSELPEEVTFTISRPPGYEHMSLEQVRAHFRRLLDQRLAEIHAERRAEGRTRFMGRDAVLAQDPFDSPASGTVPTFARNPRVACPTSSERRVALIRDLQAWRREYGSALAAWRAGDRSVEFPYGSYALPRFHGARTARATGPPPLT